jgi:hypothetical protein
MGNFLIVKMFRRESNFLEVANTAYLGELPSSRKHPVCSFQAASTPCRGHPVRFSSRWSAGVPVQFPSPHVAWAGFMGDFLFVKNSLAESKISGGEGN